MIYEVTKNSVSGEVSVDPVQTDESNKSDVGVVYAHNYGMGYQAYYAHDDNGGPLSVREIEAILKGIKSMNDQIKAEREVGG